MKRLAIVTTHPIAHETAIFQTLEQRNYINIRVFYTCGKQHLKLFESIGKKGDNFVNRNEFSFEWVLNNSKSPGPGKFNGVVNPQLIPLIKDYRPDGILFFNWQYKSHFNAMRYFNKKVSILFRNDSISEYNLKSLTSFLKTAYLKWVYKHINIAIYTDSLNKEFFTNNGLKASQCIFAGPAIDDKLYRKEEFEDILALRKSLNIKRSDILLLFAGKLDDEKDPIALISAFKQLSCRNCHLLFVGTGELKTEIEKVTKSSKTIHLMTVQNENYMPVIYQASQIFCVPSKRPKFTWEYEINKAMASRKPLLVSNQARCAKDLVKDNYNWLHI